MPKIDRGQILIGGAPAAELQDGSYEIVNGSQIQIGIGGVLGTCDGVPLGTISFKRAVPKANFGSSQDLHDAVMKQQEISIMAISGGKKIVVTGVPTNLGRGWGVTSAAVENGSLHGKVTVSNL